MNANKLLSIRGKVQGVSYRIWAQKAAKDHNLTGWVRNRLDGSVEMLVMGETRSIAHFIESCYQGPPHCVVDEIKTIDTEAEDIEGFEILQTA